MINVCIGDEAKAIYFYGPMGITVLCNICLFISTALKIRQHGKDTAQHLRSMDSRRHDDNKQWFVLFLFIIFLIIYLLYCYHIVYIKYRSFKNIYKIID